MTVASDFFARAAHLTYFQPRSRLASQVHRKPDPTLPRTPVTVGGKSYDLCFDLEALAQAELAINMEAGNMQHINLLFALPCLNVYSVRIVFAAALRTHHPEISFEGAKKLVKMSDLLTIYGAIKAAWDAATPEAEVTGDPPLPGK